MKTIIKKTIYVLFKPSSIGNNSGKYFYTRVSIEGVEDYSWIIGYENHLGLVSTIGGGLDDHTQRLLENEYAQSLLASQ